MLTELEDELARSRVREAFWISVVIHMLLAIALFTSGKWMPNWAQPHLVSVDDLMRGKQPTYLALPQDALKQTRKPNTEKLSDKNRIAQSPHAPDPKTLEELRRGNQQAPGPNGPQMAQPAPQNYAQSAPQHNDAQGTMGLPQQRMVPEQPQSNPFRMPGSAGDQIASATRNIPRGGGGGGMGLGSGPVDRNARMGGIDILSDTQGVDFGPYLSRALQSIKMNWYNLIPEEARPPMLKHGKVSIRFLILPDGRVSGLFVETPSGDVPLDRAAYGGISASNPFSPLPHEFHGQYLALRIRFFYNPRTGEMEEAE
ncbi:MAG: energy transducer TonB [Acidobacteriota bacterium]|nr:energy transducer TonB [Acidobacteriota bacterium]